jgi:hypothetical protein
VCLYRTVFTQVTAPTAKSSWDIFELCVFVCSSSCDVCMLMLSTHIYNQASAFFDLTSLVKKNRGHTGKRRQGTLEASLHVSRKFSIVKLIQTVPPTTKEN